MLEGQTQTDTSLFEYGQAVALQRLVHQEEEAVLDHGGFELLDFDVVLVFTEKGAIFPVSINLLDQVRLEFLLKVYDR